jgi:hypothetical protein
LLPVGREKNAQRVRLAALLENNGVADQGRALPDQRLRSLPAKRALHIVQRVFTDRNAARLNVAGEVEAARSEELACSLFPHRARHLKVGVHQRP